MDIHIQNPSDDATFLRHAQPSLASLSPLEIQAVNACPGAAFDVLQAAMADAVEQKYLQQQEVFPEGRFNQCNSALDALDAWSTTHETAIANALGAKGSAHFVAAIRSLRSFNEMIFKSLTDLVGSYAARDLGMADVFELLRPAYAGSGNVAVFAQPTFSSRLAESCGAFHVGIDGHSPRQPLGRGLCADRPLCSRR